MSERPQPISISAVAKMPSARLGYADLEFFAGAVEGLKSVVLTWSTREMHSVTASNFSAQSPSIKVVRTFKANSMEEFATQAPGGKIYIMEALFETENGAAVLQLGRDDDLSRDLIIGFEGVGDQTPSWFDEIVSELVAARLLHAAMREFCLTCLAWLPVFLFPIAVPLGVASGRLPKSGGLGFLLMFAGVAWLAYTAFATTIVRFVRASSLRVKPLLFAEVPHPEVDAPTPLPAHYSSRLKDFQVEVRASLKSGWLAFRHSDHQFNAVLLAVVALIVAILK